MFIYFLFNKYCILFKTFNKQKNEGTYTTISQLVPHNNLHQGCTSPNTDKTNVSLNRHLKATRNRLHELSHSTRCKTAPIHRDGVFHVTQLNFFHVAAVQLLGLYPHTAFVQHHTLIYQSLNISDANIQKIFLKRKFFCNFFLFFFCGGRGIRTPGPFRAGTLAMCWFKPLTHPSNDKDTLHSTIPYNCNNRLDKMILIFVAYGNFSRVLLTHFT